MAVTWQNYIALRGKLLKISNSGRVTGKREEENNFTLFPNRSTPKDDVFSFCFIRPQRLYHFYSVIT